MKTIGSGTPAAGELDALLRLLDDRDDTVGSAVEARLIDLGEQALAHLLPLTRAEDLFLRARAIRLAEEIAAVRPLEEFRLLAATAQRSPVGDISLAMGCIALARTAYPAYDAVALDDALMRLSRGLGLRMDRSATDGERLHAITRFFFEEELFAGNTGEYYDPDNSFINRVLETRRGIPISLAAVMLLVGQRLGLPLHGVNMPAHFLLKYSGTTTDVFMDPFGGRLLSRADCERLLANAGVEDTEGAMKCPSDRQIILRMLNNAVFAYERRGDAVHSAVLRRCADVLRGASSPSSSS